MIVLIAASAWMLALLLVAGLCVAARQGDRAATEDLARERGQTGTVAQPAAAAPSRQPAAPAPLQRAA